VNPIDTLRFTPSITTPSITNDCGPVGAQRRIDQEVTRHIRSLRDLCFQRNTFSPIFRLPPEILAEIFVQGARYHHERCLSRTDVPEWVNVSYVCRQWRNIALHCPTLWGYLFLQSQQWTETLLARSKQVPLNISVGIGHPRDEWLYPLMEKVADHAERIQELRLYAE